MTSLAEPRSLQSIKFFGGLMTFETQVISYKQKQIIFGRKKHQQQFFIKTEPRLSYFFSETYNYNS